MIADRRDRINVLNDPVNLVDPTGEFAHILGGFVGGAIGGGVMGAISGGIVAAATGQSIWQGAAKGALTGAVIGGVTGGLLMTGFPYIPVASQAFSEGLLYGLWGTKLPSALSIGFNILKTPGVTERSIASPCL